MRLRPRRARPEPSPARRALLRLVVSVAVAAGFVPGPLEAQEPLVRSSDPALQAMAAELLPDLARRSGMELREPVRLEKRSRVQLVRYLEAKLDEDLPEEEARTTVAAYHLLGLVPEDLDLRSVLLSLYTEQVAGFYEPDSTALFILEDQPPQALQGLLVHELVHAVQDQSADLPGITDPDRGNDRATAAHAAVEGHATLVMLEFLTEQLQGEPVDLAEVPEFSESLRPALEGMRQQFPALASAPRVIQESLLFPYLEGAGFVQRLWVQEGRVPPFGTWLPASTEQILEGDLQDRPLEVTLELPDGWTTRESDALGRLELEILLATHAGEDAAALAEGWGGDRWTLLDGPGGATGLVLATAWDDAGARNRFVGGLTPHLGSFPRAATLRSLPDAAAPTALLRVGVPESVPVRVTVEESSP